MNYVIGATGTLPARGLDRLTCRVLNLPGEAAEALVARCAAHAVPGDLHGLVRLRDLVTPLWTEVFHEMISDGGREPEAGELMAAAVGVARLSEATARVLTVLAADPDLQYEAGGDPSLLEAVIEDTMWRHPSLENLASAAVRAATEEVIWRYALVTAAADRGPCLVVPRSGRSRSPLFLRARLVWLWVTRFRPVDAG